MAKLLCVILYLRYYNKVGYDNPSKVSAMSLMRGNTFVAYISLICCRLLLLLHLLPLLLAETEVPQLRVLVHPQGGDVQRDGRFDFTCKGEASPGQEIVYTWKKIATIDSLNPQLVTLVTGISRRK